MTRLRRNILLFSSAIFLFGCQEQDVHVYRVAKEHPGITGTTTPMLAEAPAAMPADAQPSGDLSWKAPAEWQAVPASGMRLASFAFQGKNGSKADISVVALPGMAGGELANINRWRGQLGLEPMNESGMAAHSQKIKSKAGELLVVDFTGTDPKGQISGKARMLGAILSLRGKQWFFKVMGEDPVVAQAKPSFLQFIRSLRASNG